MKLSKIDLSSVIAATHKNGQLELLVDRGEEIELIEIAAPVAALEGLQQLDYIVNHSISSTQSIEMHPVASNMANAIGYDSEREILQIEFASGSVYQYQGVEEEVWESLCDADSTGGYYNYAIKGNYESQRLE